VQGKAYVLVNKLLVVVPQRLKSFPT